MTGRNINKNYGNTIQNVSCKARHYRKSLKISKGKLKTEEGHKMKWPKEKEDKQ